MVLQRYSLQVVGVVMNNHELTARRMQNARSSPSPAGFAFSDWLLFVGRREDTTADAVRTGTVLHKYQ